MPYEIRFSERFDKDFAVLKENIRIGCLKKIKILADNPYYGKALVGKLRGLWELKLSKYRIVYQIFEREKEVRLVTVDLRDVVFDKLGRIKIQ